MGDPVKKGNWGNWATIQPAPNKKRITCYWCAYYQDDGSCEKQPTIISEIGSNFWKTCKYFELDKQYDTQENRECLRRIRPDYSFSKSVIDETKRAESENLNTIVPTVRLVGKYVSHKILGRGIIACVDKSIVTVSFSSGNKRFKYPDAFAGFLIIEDEHVRRAVELDIMKK